jgi:hypothetical protein
MNKHVLRRGVSALGVSLAVAVVAIAQASFAQPQQLPGQQYQAPSAVPYGSPYPPPQTYQGPQRQYAQPPYGQPAPYADPRGSYRPDERTDGSRVERRISVLHQRLGITPAQEAAWTGFAAEMRNSAMAMDRAFERNRGERRPINAVERLEQRERGLAARQAELDHMVRALQPLYASFSDEQKRIADQVLFRAERRGPGYAGGPGPRPGRPG